MKKVMWYDFEGFSVAHVGPFSIQLEQKTSSDKWVMCCERATIYFLKLASSDLNEAKCQATAKLQVVLEEALDMILGK